MLKLRHQRVSCLALPVVICLAGLGAGAPRVGRAQEDDRAAGAGSGAGFTTTVLPFLKEYCYGCHSGRRPRAAIGLDSHQDPSTLLTRRDIWEKVLHMLRGREMPPEEESQPSELERGRVSSWIEAELSRFDCSQVDNPGRVTMRRLTRVEYNHTIRDLFALEFQPAEGFPADEVGYGFDNIGDLLSLPPLLAEKYLDAADEIVERFVAREAGLATRHRFEAERLEASGDPTPYDYWALSINKEGEVAAEAEFPADGEYVFRARAWAQQAGPEVAKLGFRLDGEDVATREVPAVEGAPDVYETRRRVAKGRHRVAVSYVNNYVNNDSPDPALRGDRNLLVDWFEVERVDAAGAPVGRLFTCLPLDQREPRDCLETILRPWARKIFRRPVGDDELWRLFELAETEMKRGSSFADAVAFVLKTLLVSPRFLFRVEAEPDGLEPGAAYSLDGFALASRLSYFLWASTPDDELLRAAEAGELGGAGGLETQARRMLASPQSRALVENFAGQWLQTRSLAGVSPDPDLFPAFDDRLRRDMETETLRFFQAIVEEDRSILDLLDADFTFLNERLARHYGYEGIEGEEFRRVRLDPDAARGGVLTQGSVLTLTSNPTRTSPVKRGKWILERILGTPPPPPPPEVEELSEDPEATQEASLRQRMESHRSDPNCGVCHNRMDPIGFAFENFDAVGAWRDFDGLFLIDSAGELPSGDAFDGPEGLKALLRGRSEEFGRNFASQLLTYALGRGLEYYDKCAVDQIVEAMVLGEYRFSSVVLAVVKSDPFRMKRGRSSDS